MESSNANAIVIVLKSTCMRMNLILKNCPGHCYDGCVTVNVERNSVATEIQSNETRVPLFIDISFWRLT